MSKIKTKVYPVYEEQIEQIKSQTVSSHCDNLSNLDLDYQKAFNIQGNQGLQTQTHHQSNSVDFNEVNSDFSDDDGEKRRERISFSSHKKSSFGKHENLNDLNENALNFKLTLHNADTKENKRISRASIEWRKLSNVFHSLRLLRQSEVIQMPNVENFENEILSGQNSIHKNDKFEENKFEPRQENPRQELIRKTFDNIYRNNDFFQCCEGGSQQDLKNLISILNSDPKKYKIDRRDPNHLINKHSITGFTPLYVAARNGHLNILKFLIESEANPFLLSKVGGIEELPIEVASRWGHLEIVKYLLTADQYNPKVLNNCVLLSQNSQVKSILKKYLVKRKKSCFGCF